MAVMFNGGDYKDTIIFAKELIAVPGHENDMDAWQYIAKSYFALGDKASEKEADQKILAYYDTHPAEKSSKLGGNIYADAQKRLKG
jgi:hypothetical protein